MITKNMLKKHFALISLFVIFIAGFLISINQIKKPMIAEADAYSRVNVASGFKMGNIFFDTSGEIWLPLHFTMMVSILSFFDYPLIAPRLITLFFSLLSIIAMYFYSQSFLKNKYSAVLAALLFLIFPLRIYLGTQTLSEPIFVFFMISSLIFISKDHLSYKEMLISLLFLNIAHGIRFESWMLLPFIWLFIASKQMSKNKKIFYTLLSAFFPIYWMYLAEINSNNFLYFFNQKYEVAQRYQSPIYFNLQLSMFYWKNKLVPIFPTFFIFLSLLNFKNLIKEFTPKKIFFYFIPIFFYSALVIQVFLGTMEWFPTRYLLIPTAFLIPILASSLSEIFKFLRLLFLKLRLLYKVYLLFFILIFIFIIQNKYFESLKYTELEITDWSLLQSYSSHETIDNSLLYKNFSDLINECEIVCDQKIFFFYEEKNRSYLDQGLFYFLNKPGTDINKKDINKLPKKPIVFVWERSLDDEKELIKNFKIIYKNDKFYILNKQ